VISGKFILCLPLLYILIILFLLIDSFICNVSCECVLTIIFIILSIINIGVGVVWSLVDFGMILQNLKDGNGYELY
jgi:hypothetical protein